MVTALENEFELFELNASDLRNRKKLDEILKKNILQIRMALEELVQYCLCFF